MKNLMKVIDRENEISVLVGDKKSIIDPNNITPKQAKNLFLRLNSNLSPEVLFCDGERSRAEAAKYKKLYLAAIKELEALGFKPDFEMYNVY